MQTIEDLQPNISRLRRLQTDLERQMMMMCTEATHSHFHSEPFSNQSSANNNPNVATKPIQPQPLKENETSKHNMKGKT